MNLHLRVEVASVRVRVDLVVGAVLLHLPDGVYKEEQQDGHHDVKIVYQLLLQAKQKSVRVQHGLNYLSRIMGFLTNYFANVYTQRIEPDRIRIHVCPLSPEILSYTVPMSHPFLSQ